LVRRRAVPDSAGIKRVLRFIRYFALGELKEKERTMPTKSSSTHTSSKGEHKIDKVMKEHKSGTLKSSSGKKVTSRKQAVAIALSEARKSGAKIPRKKHSG
jgi:hypothetical protein